MLSGLPHRRGERGFTLVEVLVAMAAGLVVIGALYSILTLSLRQTARITNETSASQHGRTAMAKILAELQTTCISPQFTPVQAGSSATKLIFISGHGSEAVLAEAEQHELVWSESAHTLTDTAYKNSGGEWPAFKFESATPTSVTQIAERISKYESGGTTQPIFAYYKYAEAPLNVEGEAGPASTLEEIAPPASGFSSEEAATIASVRVSFDAAATSAGPELEHSIELSSQVTFAFSVPNSETPIHDAPCQ